MSNAVYVYGKINSLDMLVSLVTTLLGILIAAFYGSYPSSSAATVLCLTLRK